MTAREVLENFAFFVIIIYMKRTVRISKRTRKTLRKGGVKKPKTIAASVAKTHGHPLFPDSKLADGRHNKLAYANKMSASAGEHLKSVTSKGVALVRNGRVAARVDKETGELVPKLELRPVLRHEPIMDTNQIRVGETYLFESWNKKTPVLGGRDGIEPVYSVNLEVTGVAPGPDNAPEYKRITTAQGNFMVNSWKRSMLFYDGIYAFNPDVDDDINQEEYWGSPLR